MHHRSAKTRGWQWEPPSPRVRELIRQGAELALHAPSEWLEEIDQATLSTESMKVIAEDPVLAAGTRRTNRANLIHWASANVLNPGAPVEANLAPESLAIARDLVRRGVSESALHAYRTGQNAAWLRWMAIVFQLTSDPTALRELLDVTARSISSFIDATIAAISAQMNAERAELTRGTHAERREVVALILDGAPITEQNASRRLGYKLDQSHRAAVVWSDEGEANLGSLEAAAEALSRTAVGLRPLTVVATAATVWVWIPGGTSPDRASINAALSISSVIRLAIGSAGRGMDGFRRGHLDALTAQRMVARLGSNQKSVSFDEVRLVSLVTTEPDAADLFVRHTLGDLESASEEILAALRTFLREGCNASQTAERLHTHRNTLLRRLARAEELLPRPLEENRLDIGVALEVMRWRPRRGSGNGGPTV